ncbi:GlyGly-CTERM sorting domain-containing protein [Vibrio vulnificus]|nr:GlyGly-CTERM sorting domain-containing protein [Vibrio vulnificus]
MANPPQGLEIYHIVKKFDMDAGGFVQAFVKLAWSENADQSVDLTLQNPNLYPILSSSLIFTAPQVKSEGDKPDTAASSSSGGSMGMWSLWLLGLASLRRPLTSWKRQSR